MANIFALGEGVEEQKATDSLGKFTLDGALYNCKIKGAFLDKAASGAQRLDLELLPQGQEFTKKFQIYFTSKAAPESLTATKNGKTFPTFGWAKINDLCLRAVGKKVTEIEMAEKIVLVWENRKEEKRARTVLEDLIGADIAVGIKEMREDKWDDPSQKVLKNELDKFFDADTHLTTAEVNAGSAEAKFAEVWKGKYEGVVEDKTTKATTVAGGPVAGGTATDTVDIFADDK